MYTIEERGAIKYIVKNGVRVTRGHHDFSIGAGGCIIGKLGAYTEPVLTSTGQIISHMGSDGFRENEQTKQNAVLAALNGKVTYDTNSSDLVEGQTPLSMARKALGFR